MIFKGQLVSTFDINLALENQKYGSKVLYLGEKDPEVDARSNGTFIYASMLTPRYDALQAVLDNNYIAFGEMYTAYLNSNESQMLLATIVASMYRGINLVLLFPEDTGMLMYPDFIMKFLFTNLGIQPGTPSSPFIYNPAFDDINLDLMYRFNCIPVLDYLYAANNITPASLQKVISEMHIVVDNPKDIQQYISWIESYQDDMRLSNSVLIEPFRLS